MQPVPDIIVTFIVAQEMNVPRHRIIDGKRCPNGIAKAYDLNRLGSDIPCASDSVQQKRSYMSHRG